MPPVNECSSPDVVSQFDPETSVPETSSAPPSSEPAPAVDPGSSSADTFEKIDKKASNFNSSNSNEQALHAELAEINKQREELKPEIKKAHDEALWQLPKMVPVAGTVAETAKRLYDAFKSGDTREMAKAAGNTEIQGTTEAGGFFNENLTDQLAKSKPGSNVANFFKAFQGAFEMAKGCKDAYDVHTAMNEYGRLVNQDEALRLKAEAIQMKLDPKAQFSMGYKSFSQVGGSLVDGNGHPFAGQLSDGGKVNGKITQSDLDEIAKRRGHYGR